MDTNRSLRIVFKMSKNQRPEVSLPPLSDEEKSRYSRHIVMPEVGIEGQQRLKASSVVVVGAGGLGIPAAVYLASAGVGTVGIIDDDSVELSNLHRQFLFSEADLGTPKAELLKSRLHSVNPHIHVNTHQVRLSSANALDLLRPYDIVIDATDNFQSRYLINDACVLMGKPDVYGSVFRFDGQASVFSTPAGPCYRCLYPEPPPPESVQTCAEAGVLGVLTGIIGAVQANQAITTLLGKGASLSGRLLLFDSLNTSFEEVKIKRNPDCPVCGQKPTITHLVDYDEFCGVKKEVLSDADEIAPTSLRAAMAKGERPLLLDVREPREYQLCHLEGAKLIPLGELQSRMKELNKDGPIVVYCHIGIRSSFAIRVLRSAGYSNVRNLTGGIKAWAEQVDPKMPRY